MPFCTHCGTEYAAGDSFCGICGRPTASAPTGPRVAAAAAAQPSSVPPTADRIQGPGARGVLPPPPPDAATSGTTAGVPFQLDWQRLLAGNWLGAGLVALAGGLTSGLLALLVVALAKPVDFGLDNSLTFVAWLMTGAYGADLTVAFRSFKAEASVGAISLTITVIAMTVSVLVFRRVTASYTRVADAIGDAVRAALLFGLGMLVVAIAFRSDTSRFGRGWGTELARMFDIRLEIGAGRIAAFFLSLLVLLAVLLASCWLREDWWGPRVQRVRTWLAAPLYGVGVFGLLLPVAGLVGLVLVLATGHTVQDTDPTDNDTSALIALLFALLASGGFWLVGLGTGSAFGTHAHASAVSSTSETYHLGHYADDAWGLWLAPLVMLAVMYLTAYAVARRARTPERVLPGLVGWVGVVLLTTPLWVQASSLHASIRTDQGKDHYEGWGSVGVEGWQVTLLLTLAAAITAFVVALQRGALDLETLRGHARALGQKVQTNPGRPHADIPAPAPGPAQQPPPSGWPPAPPPE